MSRFPPNFLAAGLPTKVLLAVMTGKDYLSLAQIVALVGEGIPSECALRFGIYGQLQSNGKSAEEFCSKYDLESRIASGRRTIVRLLISGLAKQGTLKTRELKSGKRYKIDHRAIELRRKRTQEHMLGRKEIGPPKKVTEYRDERTDETHRQQRIYTLECGHKLTRHGWSAHVCGWVRCPLCKAANSGAAK